MAYGWTGKILRVDLSTGLTKEESTFPEYAKYLGGVGFGYKVIWDEAPTAGPFDPENRLVFAVGPMSGTAAPSSGRVSVMAISPHTYAPGSKGGLASRSSFGGYWGPELKFAGYDGLIIQGKAARPVYIWINDGHVEIRDAEHLWGKDALEAQKILKDDLGEPGMQSICCGPAGENLVRVAPILHGTGNGAGQGGFGAVMGSKNLKAVAVRGTNPVKVADREALKGLIREIREVMPAPLGGVPLTTKTGSPYAGEYYKNQHIDPHDKNRQAYRYVQGGYYKYYIKNTACFSCPLACYAYMNVPGMGGARISCTQMFYSILGSQEEAMFLAKQLADGLGINTYELMSSIPFMWFLYDAEVDGKRIIFHMEEHGLVSPEMVLALQDIHYPPEGKINADGVRAFLTMVAYRQGFLGDCMAEGFIRAIDMISAKFEELGKPEVAAKVREFKDYEGIWNGTMGGHGGWGMGMHYDPRTFGYYWSINWIMENRDPGKHSMTNLWMWSGLNFEQGMLVARKFFGDEVSEGAFTDVFRDFDTPLNWNEKSAWANAVMGRFMHLRAMIKDSLTICDWVYPILTSALPERDFAGDDSFEYRLMSAVTGMDVDQEALDLSAERIWNLLRMLTLVEWGNWEPVNLREEHDQVPELYFFPPEQRKRQPFLESYEHPPLEREKLEEVKTAYYKLMGWDPETGIPTRATLERVGLKDVADAVEARGIKLS